MRADLGGSLTLQLQQMPNPVAQCVGGLKRESLLLENDLSPAMGMMHENQ